MSLQVKLEILFPMDKNREQKTGVLDIYESDNLPLSIQYGIKNITNLGESQGAYTKTFDIPATKHNNKLLKHCIRDHKNNVTEFVDESIKARVTVNGRIVLTGAFTIKSYLKDYKDRGYTISILGDNNNWTTIMDGKMMCETLEEELNEPHTWNHHLWHWYNTNVKVDDATYPSGLPTYAIAIPHICWGEYTFPHSSAPNTFVSHLSEQTPAFFVKNLLRTYFNEAGYDLVSNFMNTKFFKKLIIPTDPLRFTHANYGTLGGGTGQGEEVVLVEANFYNDTGRGNATAIHFNNHWTGTSYVINWKWADCDETQTLPFFDPSFPIQTSNHCVGVGQVYSPSMGNPAGNYWIGERITPYNEEIVDGTNTQTVHEHQRCRNTNWQNQSQHTNLSIIWGSAGGALSNGGGVNFFNKHPIVYHNWVCVTTAVYTVEVYQSLGLMKMAAAVNRSRAKVKVQLVMHENYSNPNTTDNTWINSLFNNNGNTTVLAETDVQNGGYDTHLEWQYKEVDLIWTGTIPAGAMIYCVTSLINTSRGNAQKPFQGRAILMDRDYTQFDCGAPTNGMTGTTARETKFRIKTGTGINIGDTVTWHEYLPCDISQKQFISGLTGLFNLHWWTDESTKKVYVEPYDSFYKQKREAVDWSKKIDYYNRHETKFLTDVLNRYALYKYKDPTKDVYQQTLNLDLPVPYHAQLVDLGDQYINKTSVYGTELFGATVMIGDNQLVPLITPTPPWIPAILSDWVLNVGTSTKPERANGYNLRILSYEGLQSTGDQEMEASWANNGSGGDTDVYPRAISFIDSWVPQAGQTHAQLPYHDNSDTGAEGLYNTFYNTMFQDIVQLPRMKIAMFHLTPSDIAQLDLRKLVYIAEDGGSNGTYWKIHKIIDYQPHKDGLTKVELLQYQVKDNSIPKLTTNNGSTTGEPGDHGLGEEPIIDDPTHQSDNPFTNGTTGTGIVIEPYNDYEIGEQPVTTGGSLIMRGNIARRNNGNIALGHGLIANDKNQVVMGQYNVVTPNAKFIIGGGSSDNDRRNVLTVFNDGSVVMGENSDNLVTTDANGDYIDLYTEETKTTYKEGKSTTTTTINKVK